MLQLRVESEVIVSVAGADDGHFGTWQNLADSLGR